MADYNEQASATVEHEQWSSKFGFVAAAVGSAVGLGNIWRFPYMVGANGGGAFLLPYLIAILLCGLPVLMLELASGRRFASGVVGTFRSIHKRATWLGLLIALGAFALLSYYIVVAGWAAGYFAYGLLGKHPRFEDFTSGWNSVIFYLAVSAITVGVVSMGVRKGIEATSRVLMPLLFFMLIGLAIYGIFLPGWGDALSFYLKPDVEAVTEPIVWVRAFGQVFFSIGVGMGVMITYGAYLPKQADIPRSALTVTAADYGAALLAGLVIFPIVFSYGGEPGAGPQLAFDTLPTVFERFPVGTGYMLAILFYLLLSIAAISSAVSLLETSLVGLREARGVGRRKGLYILAPALVLLGLPSALSYSGVDLRLLGSPILDIMDEAVGTFGLSVAVLITALVLGWMGWHRLDGAISKGFVGWSGMWLVRIAAPAAIIAAIVGLALQ